MTRFFWAGVSGRLAAKDNLDAYIRMTRSMDPGDVTVGWFGGRVFSVIGDLEVIKPLFDVEGFGIGRTLPQADGSYRALWREVGYYKDLASGKIMETWANPLLDGEVVETYPINNDPVNSHLRPEFRLGFGATKDELAIDSAHQLGIVDFEGPAKVAYFPYEILVNGADVEALHMRFRMAVHFPDLSMMGDHGFTKLMASPGATEDAFEALLQTEGENE